MSHCLYSPMPVSQGLYVLCMYGLSVPELCISLCFEVFMYESVYLHACISVLFLSDSVSHCLFALVSVCPTISMFNSLLMLV